MIGRARATGCDFESEKMVEQGNTWFWVSQELHGMKVKIECSIFHHCWSVR